uniref:AIG1-type G domain-containing protein n=1 Tax=Myripristis murdjan TaxID=586833 RepID=A0A667WI50_9TELE
MASENTVSNTGKFDCNFTFSAAQAQQSQHSPELRIVLIGGRELHGKPSRRSATGNTILGKNVFDTSTRTAQSVAGQQEVHGRQVTVVDTPGWWWHYPRENTPLLDQLEIKNSVYLCPPEPHAFLLVIPFGSVFPEIFKKSLEEHLQLFHKTVFDHTIVLFSASTPCSHERLNKRLQWLVEKCGNRYHVLDNQKGGDENQVTELLEKVEEMLKANRGSVYEVDLGRAEQLEARKQAQEQMAQRNMQRVQRQKRVLRELFRGK